ncbi:MAG: hypothetical protein AAF465_05335 [Pseudomonadota bacterium]
MSDNESTSVIGAITKQAQVILTLFYLSTVAIGMLYYHQKYSEFGINIFQYADILHFLVAPFEDAYIIRLCLVAIVVLAFGYSVDRFSMQHFPRLYRASYWNLNDKPWFETFKTTSWLLSLVALIVINSYSYGAKSKDKILARAPVTVTFEDGSTMTGRMIGKASDTVFLIDGDLVRAIPMQALVRDLTVGRLDGIAPEARPATTAANPANVLDDRVRSKKSSAVQAETETRE